MVAADESLAASYLLPTAPEALVAAVRRHVASSEADALPPAARTSNEHVTDGHGPLAHRHPWQLLHVDRSAPPDVVDIAYRIWRESHANSNSSQVHVRPPAPAQVPGQHADADDRVATLAMPAPEPIIPRASSNGAPATHASIESLSGDHRFGIGREPLRIGVDPTCDVVVHDEKHNAEARIWPHGNGYMLRVAAGSVLVNGAPADWVVLDDGDILEIGDAAFRFRRQTH